MSKIVDVNFPIGNILENWDHHNYSEIPNTQLCIFMI